MYYRADELTEDHVKLLVGRKVLCLVYSCDGVRFFIFIFYFYFTNKARTSKARPYI